MTTALLKRLPSTLLVALTSYLVIACTPDLETGLIEGDKPCESLESNDNPVAITKNGIRCIRAFEIPVPETISPEAQAFLADPKTNSPISYSLPEPSKKIAWHIIAKSDAKRLKEHREKLLEEYPVAVVEKIIAGVKVREITPQEISPDHQDHLLLSVHGGAYVFGRGDISEALYTAHYGKVKVIAIDYGMPPEHPFPAAIDDIAAVYEVMHQAVGSENIAIFGNSAGGGLTAAATLKIRDMGLEMPGAVGLLTPSVDLEKGGDSLYSNQYLDKILPARMPGAIELYIADNDPSHPYMSPINGDFSKGFPPAYLLTGTRDMLLSLTARMHRALHRAGIETELHVFEAMPHGFQVVDPKLPESQEAIHDMMRFFKKHLGRDKPIAQRNGQ